jgi:serine/threonine protein kinase
MTAKQDGEPISLEQVVQWYVQALHGLSYMHWRGVLHRDIKPDNLLTEGDNGAVLKIGDMGSVRQLPGEGPHPSPDKWVPAAVTTPGYAAPEAHTQAVYYSGSDLWSVGATFYEVFTLEPLVPASDDLNTPEAISELVSQFDPSQLEMGPTAGSLDGGGLVADLPELLRTDPRTRPSASELTWRPASEQVLRALLEQKHGLLSVHFDEMTCIHEDWLEACRAGGDQAFKSEGSARP